MPLRLNPRPPTRGVARRYRIGVYPSVLLLRPDGSEVGRIAGFAPPAEFLAGLRVIRGGRTVAAKVAVARGEGRTHERLLEAMAALEETGRLPEALELARWFHREERASCCRGRIWLAELALVSRVYRDVALWITGGLDVPPEVPVDPVVSGLRRVIGRKPGQDDAESLVTLLRDAYRYDTAEAGARAPIDDLGPDALAGAAERLYEGGDYADAARLWRAAVAAGIDWDGAQLYRAAERLLRARTELGLAEEWAEAATKGPSKEPRQVVAMAVVARVRIARGRRQEGAASMRLAAMEAVEQGLLAYAHRLTGLRRQCSAGEPVVEPAPPFESWPR